VYLMCVWGGGEVRRGAGAIAWPSLAPGGYIHCLMVLSTPGNAITWFHGGAIPKP
jgi:hypothetical protein